MQILKAYLDGRSWDGVQGPKEILEILGKVLDASGGVLGAAFGVSEGVDMKTS